MNIILHVLESFLQTADVIVNLFQSQVTYPEFQNKLHQYLCDLGRNICQKALETLDEQIKNDPEQRKDWVVERKDDEKTIMSIFGPVTYKRTYYRNKITGEYAYLVDRLAGIEVHARTDLSLKAKVVDLSTEVSYRKAGAQLDNPDQQTAVSGQTVMNALRRIPLQTGICKGSESEKKKVRYLHVQADEDHVKLQNGKTALAKLVYVSEGYSEQGRRKALKNVHYISGVYRDNEQLYEEVWEYIDGVYDTQYVEKIFVYGDGAVWIRELCEYLPNSVFLLDRYHINRYVIRATASAPHLRSELWDGINRCDINKVKEVLKKAREAATSDSAKKAVLECRRYLIGNWDGICAWKEHSEEVIGCSAEGHVSHVLSARLSSRPMAWSEQGADRMAKLRGMKANGISIQEYILEHTSKGLSLVKISEERLRKEREMIRKVSREVLDNIPVFKGPVTQLTRSLKGLIRQAVGL